jgi:hypothetical protein
MLSDDKLKSILYPHFGYLPLFKKLSDKAPESNLIEIKEFINNNSHLIKYLPKNIHSYSNYTRLIMDFVIGQTKHDILRFIKDRFPSAQKNLITPVYHNYLSILKHIMDSDMKTRIFLRTISKYTTLPDLENWLNICQSMNVNVFEMLNETLSQYTGPSVKVGDKTFIKLEVGNFREVSSMIPTNWCIRSESTFRDYLNRQRIVICIDPYAGDTSCILGFNIHLTNDTLMSVSNRINYTITTTQDHRDIFQEYLEEIKVVEKPKVKGILRIFS